MRPTNMVLSKLGNTGKVVFENARIQVSIEASPKMLVKWAHDIIERFEPEAKDD